MACPECGKQVSDKAPSCPECGCPISAQVIEGTGKKWKFMQFAGIVMMLVGTVSCMIASYNDEIMSASGTQGDGSGLPIMFLLGVFLYGGGRIGAWWYHK